MVRAGDLWFALENDAELIVARANPKQFEILKRYTVADSATWAQPVLSGKRVFVRDVNSVSLWTLAGSGTGPGTRDQGPGTRDQGRQTPSRTLSKLAC